MIPNIGWFSILLEYYARVTFAKIKKKKSQESSNCYPLPISKAFNWASSIKGDRVIYWSYLGLSILSLTLLNWTELLLYPPLKLSHIQSGSFSRLSLHFSHFSSTIDQLDVFVVLYLSYYLLLLLLSHFSRVRLCVTP